MVSRLRITVPPHPFHQGFEAKMRVSLSALSLAPAFPHDGEFNVALGVGSFHPEQDFDLPFEPRKEDSTWTENLFHQTFL